MKNYFKKGTKGDYSFIVGYRKSYTVSPNGEMTDTLKIYFSDGACEEYEYSKLLEINTLKQMREQFTSIDSTKLRGKSLREYEKLKFFLEHEAALNKALFAKAKRDGLYHDCKNVSPKMLELLHRFPICEKEFARSINAQETHMRVVNNAELAERLDISVEELLEIKAKNPNPAMDNFSLLISVDRMEPDEIELGLAHYGFDLLHYKNSELLSVLTGEVTEEQARSMGLRLISKKEFAEHLNISQKELAYIESLRNNENILDTPLITANDLDSYSLDDLKNILNGTYGKEYETEQAKNSSRAKAKRFSFSPVKEKLFNLNSGKRAAFY